MIAVHATLLLALFYPQPRISPAEARVLQVSLITLPRPLPMAPASVDLQLQLKPLRVQRAATPPLDAPSPVAISLPPAPPAVPFPLSAEVASTLPSPPTLPLVPPRFDAAYLQNPPPAYPALSRRLGEQGRVLLRVLVRPDGVPESVELRQSSGAFRLDEAALEVVRKWRFVPARQGDIPVTAAVIVPIVFSLEG